AVYRAVRKHTRTPPGGQTPWLEPRRHRDLRDGLGRHPRSGARTDRAAPGRDGTERDDAADSRQGRVRQPDARGAGQPFRIAAAGARVASLPATDPGPEA